MTVYERNDIINRQRLYDTLANALAKHITKGFNRPLNYFWRNLYHKRCKLISKDEKPLKSFLLIAFVYTTIAIICNFSQSNHQHVIFLILLPLLNLHMQHFYFLSSFHKLLYNRVFHYHLGFSLMPN